MKTETTACILCSRNCGLVVGLEDGKLTSIRGDEHHPKSRGYLCQKAARLEHYQHHGDRLQHPLQRQPDGSFARVGWDEALTDIAGRLTSLRDRYGGDAFAFVGGGGQGNHLGGAYGRQLLAAMKSRYAYNSLGQEKTGDFWVNGRLFGRQTCRDGAMRMHPDDARALGLGDGALAVCQSAQSEIEVVIALDDTVRRGVVTLPHGYGMCHAGSPPAGPQVNVLTSGQQCDPRSKTPFHKYVPVDVRRRDAPPARSAPVSG